jgi:hypothetical protein
MKRLITAFSLALAAASPVSAQQQATQKGPSDNDIHEQERQRFDFGELTRGRDSDQKSPRAANFDEAKVGNLVPPPLFASPADKTRRGWEKRRAELARLLEDDWVGHIPEAADKLQIVWHKGKAESHDGYPAEHWTGSVIAPDGRSGPVIDATITFPKKARKRTAPALIDYAYIWPANFKLPGPPPGGPKPPDTRQMVLDAGWAQVDYRPQLLQADNAAQMRQGVIGLARWPRDRHDWGALRAWGWGASKLREELARDPRIDGRQISLSGHSRFGKAVLVAATFDHKFADALVSSSGAGGTKLMRRDFGEAWTNMAGNGAFHWYTPNVMEYAGHKTVADLPVDAHMLIALRAPRPLFVSVGSADKGDAWVDPTGEWIATDLAEPAWRIYGLKVPSSHTMPKVLVGYTDYPLAFRQHDQGHVPWPSYAPFIRHEREFAGGK